MGNLRWFLSAIFLLFIVYFGASACNQRPSPKRPVSDKKFDSFFSGDSVQRIYKRHSREIQEYAKYSYLLIGMQNGQIDGNATGFFVKRCGKLFLVSNFHVLTFRSFLDLSPLDFHSDTLLIRYGHPGHWEFFPISVNDVYKSLPLKHTRHFIADMAYYEVPELADKEIYTIDIKNSALNYEEFGTGSLALYFGYEWKDTQDQNYFVDRIPDEHFTTVSGYGDGNPKFKEGFRVHDAGSPGESGSPYLAVSIIRPLILFSFVF